MSNHLIVGEGRGEGGVLYVPSLIISSGRGACVIDMMTSMHQSLYICLIIFFLIKFNYVLRVHHIVYIFMF